MTSETLLMPAEPGTRKFTARVEKAGLGTIEVIEKATGAKPGETGVASAADLSAAAAGTAQGSWGKFARPARGDVLREVSRLLLAHSKEIAGQLVRETCSELADREFRSRWLRVCDIVPVAELSSHRPSRRAAGKNPPSTDTLYSPERLSAAPWRLNPATRSVVACHSACCPCRSAPGATGMSGCASLTEK
jgi:acyl-CoA reductase-like NAD-dependent aldehyde dehydrogenase